MLKQKERILTTMVASVAQITITILVLWVVLFFTPAAKSETNGQQTKTQEQKSETQKSTTDYKNLPSTAPVENKEEPVKTTKEAAKKDIELKAEPKPRLKDVIKAARRWGPAYKSWYGKKAPDFTLNDMDGKKHKLSDYKGKNVMIIFWATWCGPCRIEVPHLIALRNIISKDDLVMLAISDEKPLLVKQFVDDKKINYPVFTTSTSDLPKPYNQVQNIPCSFFIDSEGKIKLATEGLLSLGEMKAILQAK